MKYKAILFDLDGTLFDTSGGIFHCANYSVQQIGLEPVYDENQLRKFIGPPLNDCFDYTFGVKDRETQMKLCDIYRKEYYRKGQYDVKIYDGIRELLRACSMNKIPCSVCTNKLESLAVSILRDQGIDKFFYSIIGANKDCSRTKADMCRIGATEFRLPLDEIVLVGDTLHDMQGALEAGIRFIGVDYGFGFRPGDEIPEGMDCMISHPMDLLDKLWG